MSGQTAESNLVDRFVGGSARLYRARACAAENSKRQFAGNDNRNRRTGPGNRAVRKTPTADLPSSSPRRDHAAGRIAGEANFHQRPRCVARHLRFADGHRPGPGSYASRFARTSRMHPDRKAPDRRALPFRRDRRHQQVSFHARPSRCAGSTRPKQNAFASAI